MSDPAMKLVKMTLHQTPYEIRQYWRSPPNAVFAMALPIIFLLLLGSLLATMPIQVEGITRYDQYFVPAIIAFGLIGTTFTNLAMTLSIRRESGLLHRLRTTPLPASALLAALIINSLLVSICLVVIMGVLGVMLFHVAMPRHPLSLLAVLGVAWICFCAMGAAMATVIPSSEAAPGVVNAVFLPVAVASGAFFPISGSSWLGTVMVWLPVRPFVQLCISCFSASSTPSLAPLLVTGIWGIACFALAVRFFRWSPKRN